MAICTEYVLGHSSIIDACSQLFHYKILDFGKSGGSVFFFDVRHCVPHAHAHVSLSPSIDGGVNRRHEQKLDIPT